MSKNTIKRMLKEHSIKACILVNNFRKETEGVAAVEFAFLAPLMLLMYIGTLEISNAISANRKLSRSAYTIGDLITQFTSSNSCITKTQMNNIVAVADKIMYPYTHNMEITLTGITVADGTNNVEWSEAYNGGTAHSKNSIYADLPSEISDSDGFIVAAKIKMNYAPFFGFTEYSSDGVLSFNTTAIPMKEELFLRPRILDELFVKNSC